MCAKYIEIKQGLNKDYLIPRKIFSNEAFRKRHNKFFGGLGTANFATSAQDLGDAINYIFDNGVTNKNLVVAKYFADRIMEPKNLTSERVELANILYSTIIKKITPQEILEGKVAPKFYKEIINSSIQNYYEHPVGKEVDYRHIAGRMISWKTLAESLPNSLTGYNEKFNCIRWTENNQADLLGVLERILVFYNSMTDSFKQTFGFVKSKYSSPVQTTYDYHYHQFLSNIQPLLELTLVKVRTLLTNPKIYHDDIMDKLDIAYSYFDKVPYNSPLMPKLMKIYSALRRQEKALKLSG